MSFDLKTLEKLEWRAPREALGEMLIELAERDPRIVVVCADLRESLRLTEFSKKFPERFIEVGVAEQNMMGVAAGLALSGKIPFACSFAAFNSGRNWDQLRVAVCYSGANVKVIGSHAGLSVGPDGATHQALEDIAITRSIPNLSVLTPSDYHETKAAIAYAAQVSRPVYIRYGRQSVASLFEPDVTFSPYDAKVLLTGNDVTLLAYGAMLYEALLAARLLGDLGIEAEVLSIPAIKPLDSRSIIRSSLKTNLVVTVEDHQSSGGLGSAVAELLSEAHPTRLVRIGVQNRFGETGECHELYEKYGLTAANITRTIRRELGR